MRRLSLFLLAVMTAVSLTAGWAEAGQRRGAPVEESPMDAMSIDELRTFQGYFYATGGRDPLTMRLPTDAERGLGLKAGPRKAPTVEEQEALLVGWLDSITESLKEQKYDAAIKTALEAINVIDNEWPPLKPEHVKLVRMNEDIRNYHRMAARLKNQQDVAAEFRSLHLKIDGVIWSPVDSKAVVNGKLLSAGEVMLDTRKQGDLRVEQIEEHGVVFQFKGMRFRAPVEIFSHLKPPRED